jgi:hypothetical protein
LTGTRSGANGDVLTMTMLFTDIVASTEHQARVGSRQWSRLNRAKHDGGCRHPVQRPSRTSVEGRARKVAIVLRRRLTPRWNVPFYRRSGISPCILARTDGSIFRARCALAA